MISDLRSCVNKIFVLPGYYAPKIRSKLRTFRDNVPVPSSVVMQSEKTVWRRFRRQLSPIREAVISGSLILNIPLRS